MNEMNVPNTIINDIFTPFQDYITAQQDVEEKIREIVRNIKKPLRETLTILQLIHHEPDMNKIRGACAKVREIFSDVRESFEQLDRTVPNGQYYRYKDHWRTEVEQLCFVGALVVFLEQGSLLDKATAADMLGMHGTNIHLDLEDYLMGLLNLTSELARYAVNAVTYGDYERPLNISKFVAELNAGFRLLNLKNHQPLRKRFDALKYDVKNIEEVVYDLSIRGLARIN